MSMSRAGELWSAAMTSASECAPMGASEMGRRRDPRDAHLLRALNEASRAESCAAPRRLHRGRPETTTSVKSARLQPRRAYRCGKNVRRRSLDIICNVFPTVQIVTLICRSPRVVRPPFLEPAGRQTAALLRRLTSPRSRLGSSRDRAAGRTFTVAHRPRRRDTATREPVESREGDLRRDLSATASGKKHDPSSLAHPRTLTRCPSSVLTSATPTTSSPSRAARASMSSSTPSPSARRPRW